MITIFKQNKLLEKELINLSNKLNLNKKVSKKEIDKLKDEIKNLKSKGG